MKKASVIAAIILALSIALTLAPLTVSAAWDGLSSATAFAGGDGSEASPFIVSNENELAYFAQSCNAGEKYAGKYIKLTADLDLGGMPFTPIGADDVNCFSGVFDGDGHTIANLAVTAVKFGGLFGCLIDAEVKNVTVNAMTITTPKYSGVIAGRATVSAGNTRVTNCHVTAESIIGEQCGGIIGRVDGTGATPESTVIENCSAQVTTDTAKTDITAMSNTFCGGIVGAAGGCTVRYCAVYNSKITAGSDIVSNLVLAGGVVGIQGATSAVCDVFNSYAVAEVSVTSSAVAKTAAAGGLIGRAGHVMSGGLGNCFANCKVTNTQDSEKAGALIGQSNQYVLYNNCYAVGDTAIGNDVMAMNYPVTKITEAQLSSAGALDEIKLNDGNSEAIWFASPVDGHPVIDTNKLATNVFTFKSFDDIPETTADPSATTAAPEVTTAAPDITTAAPEATTATPATTTAAPDVTTAPAPAAGGCGSALTLACIPVALIALLGMALVRKKI